MDEGWAYVCRSIALVSDGGAGSVAGRQSRVSGARMSKFSMSELLGAFGSNSAEIFIRGLALVLPLAVLVTLVVVLFVTKKKRPKPAANTLMAASASGVVAQKSDQNTTAKRTPIVEPPPAAKPLAQVTTRVASQEENSINRVKSELEKALSSGAKEAIAPFYLQLAHLYCAAGNEAEYLTAMRAAAGLAAENGPHVTHAEARLELADVAFKAGDLTGACEQWQIARMALQADGQLAAQASVDKRMRDNGCPTDWVLTDF